jgi:type IV pilus assembly protein PilX
MKPCTSEKHLQRGVVLITSLLLLVVVTIIALSMFRSFGIQEKIAGNMREKQRALQAAISAEQNAENWLSNNGNAVPVTCSNLLNANVGQGQVCANKLPAVVADFTNSDNLPWASGGIAVGVAFLPPGMVVNSTTSSNHSNLANPSYARTPAYYISDMGPSADPSLGEIYQVDAVGYGGSVDTVAMVESTYAVYATSSNTTH